MTDEQRAELAGCKSFSELHERLSSSTFDAPVDAAQASVGRRLTLNTAEELEDAEMLVLDAAGRVCLKATPPIRRTRVVPEPWRTNILVRGWRRLTGRSNPPAPPKDERVLPAARWRTVGSIRRYILLVLMLGQTIVAGWYMKGIMPYQGWSFVDFDEVRNQTLLQTATQVLPYALQTSILIMFGILFCWVSAGFWTALMGFLELLTGHDKYRISGKSAGDEPIPKDARTALVMPICNEDVPRVLPACARPSSRWPLPVTSIVSTSSCSATVTTPISASPSSKPGSTSAAKPVALARSSIAAVAVASNARAVTSTTSAVAGAVTTSTWWSSTPTA